jgi:hypothetical protein
LQQPAKFPASERRGIFAVLSCEECQGEMPKESRLNGKLLTHERGENSRSDMTNARGRAEPVLPSGAFF